jgi:molecular chaperone GrpE
MSSSTAQPEPRQEPEVLETSQESITESSCDCENCECGKKEEEYKENWLRAVAELENSRKRQEQERQTISRYALEGFLEELLPVVDNFYRATEHVPDEQKGSAWVTGIQYIQKNLLDVLQQRGVQEILIAPDSNFDPSTQEAIGIEESDKAEDTVAEVKQRGYKLHDKVLRPAQVIVYKNKA